MSDRIQKPEPVEFAEDNEQRRIYIQILDLTRDMIQETERNLKQEKNGDEVALDEFMILHVTENDYHTHYRWLERQLFNQGIKVTTDARKDQQNRM